jgi:hypothetical protein
MKRLDALTTAEKQALCDWQAARYGGYGQSIDCGGGLSIGDVEQAWCVSDLPTTNCAETVSQYETCVRDRSCTDVVPASCLPLQQCS